MKRITGENGYIALVLIISFTVLIYILVIKKMMCVCREKCISRKTVSPLTIYEGYG